MSMPFNLSSLPETIRALGSGESPLDGVDPAGRVDVLLAGILSELAASSPDPDLRTMYPAVRPVVEHIIHSTAKELGLC